MRSPAQRRPPTRQSRPRPKRVPVRAEAVPAVFTRPVRRLHLHLPQPTTRLHNEVIWIAVAPRLGHPKSQVRRPRQKRRLCHLPEPLPRNFLCGAGAPARVCTFLCGADTPVRVWTILLPLLRFSSSRPLGTLFASCIRSALRSNHVVILSTLLLRTKDLGEPRHASRSLRGNTRAFGSHPFNCSPLPSPTANTKTPSDDPVRRGLFRPILPD